MVDQMNRSYKLGEEFLFYKPAHVIIMRLALTNIGTFWAII